LPIGPLQISVLQHEEVRGLDSWLQLTGGMKAAVDEGGLDALPFAAGPERRETMQWAAGAVGRFDFTAQPSSASMIP